MILTFNIKKNVRNGFLIPPNPSITRIFVTIIFEVRLSKLLMAAILDFDGPGLTGAILCKNNAKNGFLIPQNPSLEVLHAFM